MGSKVIGTSRAKHDLSGLNEPLRSHGGLTEQTVPVIVNRKVRSLPKPLRNFDAFFIGCNYIMRPDMTITETHAHRRQEGGR